MRPIDADNLKTRLLDAKHLFCKNQIEFRALSPNDKARVDEIDNCIAMVINASTVDAVERKKGKWLNKGRKICCSECGRINFCKPNFCDECGADMREEKDNG